MFRLPDADGPTRGDPVVIPPGCPANLPSWRRIATSDAAQRHAVTIDVQNSPMAAREHTVSAVDGSTQTRCPIRDAGRRGFEFEGKCVNHSDLGPAHCEAHADYRFDGWWRADVKSREGNAHG